MPSMARAKALQQFNPPRKKPHETTAATCARHSIARSDHYTIRAYRVIARSCGPQAALPVFARSDATAII